MLVYNSLIINGSLGNENGIPHFENYAEKIMLVYKLFADLFDGNVMFKHNKFVDNGVSCSGGHHMMPITENLIMIKTSITDGEDESEIVFQVAYNLCKYVIYALNGLETVYDESYKLWCLSFALSVMYKYFPDAIEFCWN